MTKNTQNWTQHSYNQPKRNLCEYFHIINATNLNNYNNNNNNNQKK